MTKTVTESYKNSTISNNQQRSEWKEDERVPIEHQWLKIIEASFSLNFWLVYLWFY